MQDERGIVERLRAVRSHFDDDGVFYATEKNPDGPEAADLIEQQAREIERLREELARVASR